MSKGYDGSGVAHQDVVVSVGGCDDEEARRSLLQTGNEVQEQTCRIPDWLGDGKLTSGKTTFSVVTYLQNSYQ